MPLISASIQRLTKFLVGLISLLLFSAGLNAQELGLKKEELSYPQFLKFYNVLKYVDEGGSHIPLTDLFERLSDLRITENQSEEEAYSKEFWGPDYTSYVEGKTLKINTGDYATYCINLLASSKHQELKEMQELKTYLTGIEKETLEKSIYFEKHAKWKDENGIGGQFEYVSTLLEEVIHSVASTKSLEPRILRNLMLLYGERASLNPENSTLLASQYQEAVYSYGIGQILAANGQTDLEEYGRGTDDFVASIWLTQKFNATNPDLKLLVQCLARNFSDFSSSTEDFLTNALQNQPLEGEWKPIEGSNSPEYTQIRNYRNFISYALVKKLASACATEFELPEDLSDTYANLKFIRAQDYTKFLANYNKLGKVKDGRFKVSYKNWEEDYLNPDLPPCLEDFLYDSDITSDRDEEIDFEYWSLFDFSHPFDYLKVLPNEYSAQTIVLEMELKDDKLVSNFASEPLSNYTYWEEKYKELRATKENLSLDELNKLNKVEEEIKEFEMSVDQFVASFEKIIPLLFTEEKELISMLDEISKGFVSIEGNSDFTNYESRMFNSVPVAFSEIDFAPTHPYVISQLDKSSGYLKVMANYLKAKNEGYVQVTKKIAEEAKAPFQFYLDEYYKDQTGEEFGYASLFDYVDDNFKSFSSSKDMSLYLAGNLIYDVPNDYNDIEGRGNLTWFSGNTARLEGTIYPAGGSAITSTYSGKISKTPDSDSNKENFPFLFTTSESEKFYISATDSECDRTLAIRGIGKNEPILFIFSFKK